MKRFWIFLIVLAIYFPLFISLAFHITLQKQPFGGKITNTRNCENGMILTIESYHHRSYFQTEIEKVTKTFMFSTNKDLKPEDGDNKSDINSIYLTPSLPLENNIVVIGVAKPDGTCIEKRTRTITQTIILPDGTTTTTSSTEDYYVIGATTDYTIIIIGRIFPCPKTFLAPFCVQ